MMVEMGLRHKPFATFIALSVLRHIDDLVYRPALYPLHVVPPLYLMSAISPPCSQPAMGIDHCCPDETADGSLELL